MDGQRFDDLTRRLAAATDRRSVLRAAVGVAAGAVLASLGGRRVLAAPCPGGMPICGGACCSACQKCAGDRCVDDPSACPKGTTCLNGQCSCADGRPVCGSGAAAACCEGEALCVNGTCGCPAPSGGLAPGCKKNGGPGLGPDRITCCTACEDCNKHGDCVSNCPKAGFCGTDGVCRCHASDGGVGTLCQVGTGVVCCEGDCVEGKCTCPPGQKLCDGRDCCDTCQICGKNRRCVDDCPGKTMCSDGACRCPDGQPVCGQGPNAACCEEGAACVDGQCRCARGDRPCVTSDVQATPSGLTHVRCCAGCEVCEPAGPGKKKPNICRSTCPEGADCQNGQCTCPAGTATCGNSPGVCCDTVCEQCKNGKCTSTCPPGTICEGNRCLCPDGQPLCGGDTCCEGGATCVDGTCGCPMPTGGLAPGCELTAGPASGPKKDKIVRRVTCCAACEQCLIEKKGGRCVSSCPAPQECDASGQCACPDGRPACDGDWGSFCCAPCQTCRDGACEPCGPDQTCVDGVCQCLDERKAACGPVCCDTTRGQTCVDGQCRCRDGAPACPNGSCCNPLACETCGATGCVSTCSGPCQECDGGDCRPVTCPDNDEDHCTVAVCDPARGGCVTGPVPGCCHEDADCPDDGIFCTRSVCDTETNRCVLAPLPDGTACDDGDPCTGPGACVAGQCEPGSSLCGPCEVCTESGCAPADDGSACPEGDCCGGDCLPPCLAPQVRVADCFCACPEIPCAPGSERDPATCACCRTVCNADECGEVPDGCGGTLSCTEGCCQPITCADAGATCGQVPDGCGELLDCGPCLTCGACTPYGAPCGAAGPCCSDYCNESTGLCDYQDRLQPDGFCFVAGEPCPDEEDYWDGLLLGCCHFCANGCCTCLAPGVACDGVAGGRSGVCCGENSVCSGLPGSRVCCVYTGEVCTTPEECCSGRCVGGRCDCLSEGESCGPEGTYCCDDLWCSDIDDGVGVCTRL